MTSRNVSINADTFGRGKPFDWLGRKQRIIERPDDQDKNAPRPL